MRKYGIFVLALMLALALSACRSNDMPATTDGTTGSMPTVVTTLPTVVTTRPTEENIPGTSFIPDDNGIIGESTDGTEPSARMRIVN